MPSCDRILDLAVLLSVLQGQPRADSLPFAFPSMMLTVPSFLPGPQSAPLSAHAHYLSAKMLLLPMRTHLGSQPWGGGARSAVFEVFLVFVGHWGNLQVERPQRLMDGLSDGDCEVVVGSDTSDVLQEPCCSPSCSLPTQLYSQYSVHPVFWMEREEN